MKRKIGILLLTVTAAAAMAAGLAACTSADGASAYDLAVANGFSGTEAEWLETLNGSDGTNGTNGTNGVGIDSVALNKYNDMVVTYTDETSETLKYHGTIANPYVIYSGIYEAAYSDTFGYVSFLEEDYITVDAGETVYITYILEDAANIYIGVDGGDEDEISLGSVENYATYDISDYCTWTKAGTVVYTSFPWNGDSEEGTGITATFAVTNNGDEEITVQTAVGEYTLTFMLDKTVGTTLTSDSNYAEASFTAAVGGWYEFTLTGEGKEYVSVSGSGDDAYYNTYYVDLNAFSRWTRSLSGEYSYITYIPASVTVDFYCTFYSTDTVESATFAVSVAEADISDSLITSEGLTTDVLTGSNDIEDETKVYTYYIDENGIYTFTATAATTGAAALIYVYENYYYDSAYISPDSSVVIDTENNTTIDDAVYAYTSYTMALTKGTAVEITVYYDASVSVTTDYDGTLTSDGLTLTGLENPDDSYFGQTYTVYVKESGTYTFTYTDKTEDESGDGITLEVALGSGDDYLYYGSENVYGDEAKTYTLTAGTVLYIYAYSDADLAIAVAATDAE